MELLTLIMVVSTLAVTAAAVWQVVDNHLHIGIPLLMVAAALIAVTGVGIDVNTAAAIVYAVPFVGLAVVLLKMRIVTR